MKTLIVIQARMGSSRLPGKILMPLGSSSVLGYVVTRCRQVATIADVVVATSRSELDDEVEQWCALHEVSCYRGSENDVLSRYIEASAPYAPDYVMRVTGDCPFIDYEFATEVVRAMRDAPADFVIYPDHDLLLPRGINVELMSYSALLRMDKLGHQPRHREHVTYYSKDYPEEFTRTLFEVPLSLRQPQLRITLDTEEDYELCQAIADTYPSEVIVPTSKVIAYLLEHPEIATLNANVEQKAVM
jgi:spore coat polysaccharide biosynthesis protein SpsF